MIKKLESAFPFMKLIMYINRDIQLVLKYHYGEGGMSDEQIKAVVLDMIYPVLESESSWFVDWYEKWIEEKKDKKEKYEW